MILENWHTHTSRCGHAVGTDEEYVKAAIQAGLQILGFSDHAPYPEPMPSERMNLEEADSYIRSIHDLKRKYKKDIEIFCGMEVEYYPDQWDVLSRFRKEMDYCILGQHNLYFNGPSSYDLTNREQLNQYTDALEHACARNLCDCIAHPDVCMFSYPVIDSGVYEIAERIADISLKYNMPLELNCGAGLRKGLRSYTDGYRYPYPVRAFFEVFAKKHCPVIIGLDIHDPALFLSDQWLNLGLSVISGLDVSLLDSYDMIAAASARKLLF